MEMLKIDSKSKNNDIPAGKTTILFHIYKTTVCIVEWSYGVGMAAVGSLKGLINHLCNKHHYDIPSLGMHSSLNHRHSTQRHGPGGNRLEWDHHKSIPDLPV